MSAVDAGLAQGRASRNVWVLTVAQSLGVRTLPSSSLSAVWWDSACRPIRT